MVEVVVLLTTGVTVSGIDEVVVVVLETAPVGGELSVGVEPVGCTGVFDMNGCNQSLQQKPNRFRFI